MWITEDENLLLMTISDYMELDRALRGPESLFTMSYDKVRRMIFKGELPAVNAPAVIGGWLIYEDLEMFQE